MPQGAEEGLKRGMYLLQKDEKATVQLMGSVTLREVITTINLRDEYQIHSNVFSVTSFNELARDGMACEEYNRLHPISKNVKEAWVTEQLRIQRFSWFLQQIICVLIANKFVHIFRRTVHWSHWVRWLWSFRFTCRFM